VPYDLFISYSRRDNAQGRVTQLVERIQADFAAFAGRPLQPFFDLTEIHGMEDWRHRILQGLRESRLLLACLSPSYLGSRSERNERNFRLEKLISIGLVKLDFVMERAGTKLEFLPDLRESVLPPVEPRKANPRLILAK